MLSLNLSLLLHKTVDDKINLEGDSSFKQDNALKLGIRHPDKGPFFIIVDTSCVPWLVFNYNQPV